MSQINNIITTTFRAAGGNVVSQLNAYAGGFGRLGGVIDRNAQMSSRLNRQWMALGTTIRYAIAGSAVFGLTRMVGQLRDVNTQLGIMQAIGSGNTGAPYSTSQVTQLGYNLQQSAVDAITPVKDLNDATINLLSTVQNVEPSQVPEIISTIAKGAQLAQTPVEDLTKAVTTMNIAFGRANDTANVGQLTRQWYQLIRVAPGGISAAPEIVQQLGPLSSMFTLGKGRQVSPARAQSQMLSLALASLRFGGTPSTMLRGLTYMVQQLVTPTTTAGANALAGIGITPQFIQEKGVYAAIMRFIKHITYTGNIKNFANMTDQQMSNLDASGGTAPGFPASQYKFLRTAMRRITGIRVAAILAQQLNSRGDVASLSQDLNLMLQAQHNQVTQGQSMAKAWQRFERRAKLQQATVALNQMGLQVAQMFEPVLNFVAGGPIGLSHMMTSHRNATQIAGRTMAGLIAGVGVARFLGAGRVFPAGSMLAKLLGGGAAGGTVPRAMAMEAAVSGATGLGATPQNPLYVMVVGQLFGGTTKAPTAPTGGGGSFWSKIGGWATAGGLATASKFPGLFRSIASAGGHLGAYGAEIPGLLDYGMWLPGATNPTTGKKNAGWLKLITLGLMGKSSGMSQLQKAQAYFNNPNIVGVSDLHQAMWKGQADVNMTIDLKDAQGNVTTKKVHIPVELWAGGKHPSSRGQAGKTVRAK